MRRLKEYWLRLVDKFIEHIARATTSESLAEFPVLTRDCLTLRALRDSDLEEVSFWLTDLQLSRLVFGLNHMTPSDYVREVAYDYVCTMRRTMDKYAAIIVQEKMIGIMFFNSRELDGEKLAIVGIILGPPESRGHGYGTIAMEMMVDYLIRTQGCAMVELDTAEYNVPAQCSYRKVGFKRCASQRIYEGLNIPEDGHTAPALYYCMTREHWLELHP